MDGDIQSLASWIDILEALLKKLLWPKRIYMGTLNGHVNQRLANLVIDEQLPTWNKNDLFHYKSMYLTLKAWLLLELRHSHLLQQ